VDLKGVSWSGQLFVAVGDAGKVFTSPNGVNWSTVTLSFTTDVHDVHWTGERLIAVGNSALVVTSP
jgi:hypothetical protein